jgi:hypothetical protein
MIRKPGKRSRKRRPRFEGTLPDGTSSTDPMAYMKAWRDLAEPIAKEFGWGIIGYEPGIMFSLDAADAVGEPCGMHGHNIVLSASVATKLNKLITEAKATRVFVALLRRAST